MKWRLFHIRLCCLLFVSCVGFVSCINDSGSFSDDDNVIDEHECLLTLNVSLLETRAGVGETGTASKERMHSLRVVVLSEATDKVEVNNYYYLKNDGESLYGPILISVKPDGLKSIYLIANEESVGNLVNMTGSGTTLSDFLKSVAVESDASTFKTGITEAVFTVPETSDDTNSNIPMSAVYQIETSTADGGTRKDCGTFYIVRTMTKYSFSFRNDRVSGLPVYVKSWEISNLVTDKAYLMPHFSPTAGGYYWNSTASGWVYFGADWTETGKEWKEWLAKVSDQSNIDPDNPSADENGWLTCYNIPAGAVTKKFQHIYKDGGLEIPIDGAEHDGGVIKYLPESKNEKETNPAFEGEQEYFVNVLISENGKEYKFDPVPLPNLRSLFRNTHVRVYVRFGQTMKDDVIYAKIIDWNIWGRVEGELRPEGNE